MSFFFEPLKFESVSVGKGLLAVSMLHYFFMGVCSDAVFATLYKFLYLESNDVV